MPRVGFEPAIPATKQSQTYALDRAATGIGHIKVMQFLYLSLHNILTYVGKLLGDFSRSRQVTILPYFHS
jgi:hypothetical protein